jgi:hypothetical protein
VDVDEVIDEPERPRALAGVVFTTDSLLLSYLPLEDFAKVTTTDDSLLAARGPDTVFKLGANAGPRI